uniref:putative ATP-dependent RNA helicase TDRD12 isoform X1 n=1 Tax=Podarcis muralis TaxID=64176 RepID=UPI00109FD594|nr:putative ATP-dependent RNA helicase TDRD12 isoform X1 [Podarcis muralis]XP_028596167.1 putative ATP-dependent RNA helicase TDRD12 isoform X1 [Podarcis muralis]XP_028596168.1 putative ATP-dependent RNA helicase TDRD12 isoform X1 [Podarcis muralis]
MFEVFILKIENPWCFWGYIKGGGSIVENEMEYKKLQSEMNLFYNKFHRYVDDIKPSVLEKGQVCAVYCQEMKSWCRAVVKSIISCTDYYLAECFLVDYAKSVPVKTDRICVALESFMRLPYRAMKFRLYGTKPATLRVNYYNDKAKIVPANRWDIAAIHYFQNLLNATTKVEAKLCAVEEDSFDVDLYVTIKEEKICVNDDLLAKKFAFYEAPKSTTISAVEDQKRETPLSLEPLSEEINPALVLWPMLLQAKETKAFETCASASDDVKKTTCNNLQETDLASEETEPAVMVPVPPLKQGITVSLQADIQTDSTLCKETTKTQEMEKDLYEKNIGVKLLQFLNPLKAVDGQDETEKLQMNTSAFRPAVLNKNIEPCLSLETAPLFPTLKKELLRNQFPGPNHVQSYSWPPIARGCDSVIISPENDPLLYLLPIITFLQSRSCYVSLPARSGPVALILCPGQKKAELVFEFLETYSRCSRPIHPILLLLGTNKEEIQSIRIPRGCEVLITTPYTLLRLLEYHSLLFLRLCHLVLDEIDVLFAEANIEIFRILEYYKTALNVEEKESAPQQIVAIGRHWSKNIEHLTKEFMNDPYVVITSMEEAAIYGKVQQVVQLCLECDRISTLLQSLDFTPTNVQKTLIFTSSVEETDIIYKAVESTSIFCLKMHPDIGFHFDYVLEQWKKKFSSGTHVVLVLTDDCIRTLGITDATRVVHFSFPASPRIFGARLYSLSDNFQNSVGKISSLEKEQPNAKSILLLTEKSAPHAVGVMHYLKRTETNIPPELCNFTSGVLEAKEDRKKGRPLCRYLKAYGVCKDKKRCPDRHRVSLQIDVLQKVTNETLPATGNVTILPLFIVDATNYFGRIVSKQKDPYAALADEVNAFYKKAKNLVPADPLEKLAVYGLREENTFHRVQVLEVPPKGENSVFYSVHIKYIDEGRFGQVQNYKLLYLPEQFQALPPQAVEFIVCRVKPIDNEVEWNPKVTRYINQMIRGKPHEAKIVLALGNTIWVDPVVRVTRLLDLKTSINEYNIRSKILSTGMGTDNPEHISELQKLYRDAETVQEEKELPALIHPLKCGVSEQATSPSQSILDQATLNSQASKEQAVSNVQNDEQEGDVITNQSFSQETLQNHHDEMTAAKKADECLQPSHECPTTAVNQMLPRSSQEGPNGESHPQLSQASANRSFYPSIKWFEKQDVVVLKIKLQNITSYDCKFFSQRIIFSASVEDRFYLADMELQKNIIKEKSACDLKNGEPVITLAKEKAEPWCNLLKHKNPHVSFDFDYLDYSEERSPFSAAGTGPKKVHLVSTEEEEEEDSSDDSDTESDLSIY